MIGALCAVLGALVLLRAAVLRFGIGVGRGNFSSQRRIQLLESRSLGMKQHLQLVEVDGTVLLLGVSDSGIRRLEVLPNPSPPISQKADLGSENLPAEGSGKTRSPRLVSVLSSWLGAGPMVWIVLMSMIVLCLPEMAAAQAVTPEGPSVTVSIDGMNSPGRLSNTLQIVLLLTVISVAPSILLMATCFTRILIVLALLRQALGTATLPPSQVLVGLSLMTTVYVMTPVGEVVYEESLAPYVAEEISGQEAIERGVAPVREFLLEHTREEDLLLFLELKGDDIPEEAEDIAMPVLMPAFMISEIRAAFEIGFMIYLPFLVVDLVIASMLISLGMIMLPPAMIALPFKLMLFVLVDGWNLTLSALVAGLQ